MSCNLKDLPEVQPSSDPNMAQLQKLRIRAIAEDNGCKVNDPNLCISGEVDAGKSSTTGAILKVIDQLTDKQLKEEADKIKAKKGEDYNPTALEMAARAVEKGKEAKDRGMTIEVKAHELTYPSVASFPTGSEESKEFKGYLDRFGYKYEVFEEEINGKPHTSCKYKARMIVLDSPGHRDYINSTSAAIGTCDVQMALFPSSGANVRDGEADPFTVSLSKGSTSMGHSRLGHSQGNHMLFILSKVDMRDNEKNSENYASLSTHLSKNLGIKPHKQVIIPSSSQDLVPHNIFKKSELPNIAFYKGNEVEISVKDYRDPTRVYPLKVNIHTVGDFMHYVFPRLSTRGTNGTRGVLVIITDVAHNTKHGTVHIGQVLSGIVCPGDIMSSTQNPDCKYQITSIEQFNKPAQASPEKSFIGCKTKPVGKNKIGLQRHDMLHMDFPANNIPVLSQYFQARILFFPTDKSAKVKDHHINVEFTMVTIQKYTVQVIHVFDSKTGKNPAVVHTDDNPITSWPPSLTILNCIVKMKHPVNLPTLDQAAYGHTGNILSSRQVTGSIKLVKQVPDGAKYEHNVKGSKKAAKK